MSKSFGLNTVKDYYRELLVPSYKDLRADPKSRRHPIACAIFTWHLVDWVANQHEAEARAEVAALMGPPGKKKTTKALRKALCKKYEAFKIVAAIANGSKHFTLDYISGVSDSYVSHGHLRGPMPIYGTDSYLVVEFNGRFLVFESVLKECLDYWESFLTLKLKLDL
jgi:hypothetical protein